MSRRRPLSARGAAARTRRRGPALSIATVLALGTAGCAGVIASYDLAPNGLTRREDGLRHLLEAGRADSALTTVRYKAEAAPGDDLLRLLYQGVIAHYAGRTDESVYLLDAAAAIAEDRYTKSVTRAALSIIANDRVLAYEPGLTERLLIHYYAAAGYLRDRLLDDAAVEARRMSAVLARAAEDSTTVHARRNELAFFHTFAGTVFEGAGYADAARVAYRNAAHFGGGIADDSLVARLPRDSGEVVVLVEQGFVAHRVENAIMLELLPDEATALSGGKTADKFAAAALVSTRVLAGLASEPTRWNGVSRSGGTVYVSAPVDRRHPTHGSALDDKGKDEDDDDDEGDEDYILRVAWPVYAGGQGWAPASVWRTGAADALAEVAATDVSAGVITDFEKDRPLILARAIVRAAAKFAATKAAEKKAEKEAESEAAGDVAGMLVNLGAVLTERADTRSWHLVPHRISIVRLRAPAGRHALEVRFGDQRVETIEVEVPAGGRAFASARSWR